MITFPMLFEPLKIGRMELKNRIVFPPMVTLMTTVEGEITERQIEYYVERAKGGAALIVTESTYPRVQGYPRRIMLKNEKVWPGLKKLVDEIHRAGAKVVCQVNVHGGSFDACDPASPSNIPNPLTGVVPRQLTVEDIKELEEQFAEGVRKVVEIGYDGVMIHGATGYLVSEFLSPLVNKRTDKYGGDLKGRARLALELVEVTRRTVGTDYPIMFRLMADERVEGGFRINEATVLCKMLEEAGVDAIDITSGSFGAHEWTDPPMHFNPGCNTDLSGPIKRQVKIPVGVVGKINDPYLAEEILRDGKADFICIGRGLVADPYLPKKAMEGRTEDIRRCITCARCGELFWTKNPIGCTVNPEAGNEGRFATGLGAKTKRKRVLVIGGGPGGIEASLIASKRGHDVTLWEKTNRLGGELNIAKIPPGKGDIDIFLNYLKIQIKKSDVKVELEKEANEPDVIKFVPEVVVTATGSIPFIPDILGVSGENVINYRDVLEGKKVSGNKVIVLGGGYIGCEVALFLSQRGKEVTLAFRSEEPALDVIYPDNRLPLLKRLKEYQIKIEAGVKEYKEITKGGIRLINKGGDEIFLEGETIVLATGAKPDNRLAESLRGKIPELYEVGDCVEPRRIMEAVHEGADVGLKI